MARTPFSLMSEPVKGFLSVLQIILFTGFSISVSAQPYASQRTRAAATPTNSDSGTLASLRMSLYQFQTRLGVKARSAWSALNSPSEFDRLRSQFEEPLVATGPTSAKEDAALLRALQSFRDRAVEDNFSPLTAFLKDHKQSAWRIALLTNLGLLNYHYGFFSRALDAWTTAWQEGKEITEPNIRPLVDRAVGELARMHARLGHADDLEALFKEIGDRPVSGPATEAITGAREGLAVMRDNPGIAYLCGPMALKNLLLSEHFDADQIAFLNDVRSGPHGVTLGEISSLARKAGLAHRVVFRTPDEPVPVPSVIHWKVSHFAAIVDFDGKRYHVVDPTFGTDLWITKSAIDDGSDGYFLVPARNHSFSWRDAAPADTAQVRGMGFPGATNDGSDRPDACSAQRTTTPMAEYCFTEMLVDLHIRDTPVGYAPPIGPPVKVTLHYNQREAFQPATFSYFNVSQKWTLDVLSYIQDDPRTAGANVSRFIAGGGDVTYSDYTAGTGAFAPEAHDASVLSHTTAGAIVYKRSLADGSVETYAASNGATTNPRLVFLTQVTDPAGNSLVFTYDSQQRLTVITDATGRITTFTYGVAGKPLLVSQITDPFGRSAQISYDANGRLVQITDILGLASRFTYDASSLINAMTTPYGTTTFTYGQNGTNRFLTATDPLGHTERLEWAQPAPAAIPANLPDNLIPVGIPNPFNAYQNGRDTFYWDKHAYAVAAGNYTMARLRHWTHIRTNTNVMYDTLENYQYPFENRVWMGYPGQTAANFGTGLSGTLDYPSTIGRVLDDGTTQLTQISYDTQGHPTDLIDPVGRETQLAYAANGIDLLTVRQKTSAATFSTLAQFSYNSQHLPLTYADAAGQTTQFAYNAAGQPTQIINALGEITGFQYDSLGYPSAIINSNGKTQASFTYDSYSRVATATDSEGYTVSYAYDAANRVTQETFPDGTTRKYEYTNLDLISVTDRQGNATRYGYDAIRDLVSVSDPLNHVTRLGYWENQSLKTLTDPNGNTTSWNIDVANRVIGKQYADGTQAVNTYENTPSRLKSVKDALGQVKTFTYAKDDSPTNTAYSNAVNSTPNVSFAYDPFFRRIASMTDGTGTRSYSYKPIGAPGALQLAQESGPYTNDSINYQYDALSRLVGRTVDSSMESFAYDKLSRLITHGTALGTFNLGYLGESGQLTSQQISTGTVGTNWDYDTNLNDRRLKAIRNSGASRSFNLTTTPENLISRIEETAPLGASWPTKIWDYQYDNGYRLTQASSSAGTYAYGLDAIDNITSFQSPSGTTSASHNNLNQIKNYGMLSYQFDHNGNVLDDGLRTYTWDAENRLLSITSKTNPSLKTKFRYDGLGRRMAINTGANAGVETRYLWCGEQLCQARTPTDTVQRRYYSEGEYLPLGGTSLYYAHDQLGSVRDVLATQTGSRVASFDYDPYGNVSQSAGRVNTDFKYAGLFYDQQDGLFLTNFRTYDSRTGNWLSPDPVKQFGGLQSYNYGLASPTRFIDPTGAIPLPTLIGIISGAVAGSLAGGLCGGGISGALAGLVIGGIIGGILGTFAAPYSALVALRFGPLAGATTLFSVGGLAGAVTSWAINLSKGKTITSKDLAWGFAIGSASTIVSLEAPFIGGGMIADETAANILAGQSGVAGAFGAVIDSQRECECKGGETGGKNAGENTSPIQSDFGDPIFPGPKII